MELLANLGLGFETALSPWNLLYAFVGCLLGTAVGVLPGLGPLATIAMLLPLTFSLPPVSALIMLSGIYYGAQYGGSTTAILINLPGESSSVVTAIDGYQMARNGRAGQALATAALGSFFAGSVATVILALFAPPLANVALQFGPAEYFSLMVLGLVASVALASGSLLKAFTMIVLGLLLGLVGTDVETGTPRFTFDLPELADGLNFVALAMGVFGLGEIIRNLEHEHTRLERDRPRDLDHRIHRAHFGQQLQVFLLLLLRRRQMVKVRPALFLLQHPQNVPARHPAQGVEAVLRKMNLVPARDHLPRLPMKRHGVGQVSVAVEDQGLK